MKKNKAMKKKNKKIFSNGTGTYNYDKHKKESREKRRKKRYWLRFLIFALIVGGVVYFMNTSTFDVKRITVEGNHYFSSEEIINIADGKTGENIFWGSNRGNMKDRLVENTYIETASVKMKLPDTLDITVKERVQVAYIKYGKKYIVIDEDGMVLRNTTTKPKLTRLLNLTLKDTTEGQTIQVEESRNLDKLLKLVKSMNESNIYFKKLKISKGVAYAYVYEKLICSGTTDNILNALKDGSLEKVVYKVIKDGTTRGTISVGDNNYMSFSPI